MTIKEVGNRTARRDPYYLDVNGTRIKVTFVDNHDGSLTANVDGRLTQAGQKEIEAWANTKLSGMRLRPIMWGT